MPRFKSSSGSTIDYYGDIKNRSDSLVVLLHGLGVTWESWDYQIQFFKKSEIDILAPSIPGFGRSELIGRFKINTAARDIAEFLASQPSKNISLVGISMGGTIALQMAIDYPDRFKRLLLVNTFSKLQIENIRQGLYYLSRMVFIHLAGLEFQAKTVSKQLFPRQQDISLRKAFVSQVVQANPTAYRAALWKLFRFDVREALGKIRIPTAVLTGELDTTVPPAGQSTLYKSIPDARQILFPAGGHALIADQPEAFNAVLWGFLTTQYS